MIFILAIEISAVGATIHSPHPPHSMLPYPHHAPDQPIHPATRFPDQSGYSGQKMFPPPETGTRKRTSSVTNLVSSIQIPVKTKPLSPCGSGVWGEGKRDHPLTPPAPIHATINTECALPPHTPNQLPIKRVLLDKKMFGLQIGSHRNGTRENPRQMARWPKKVFASAACRPRPTPRSRPPSSHEHPAPDPAHPPPSSPAQAQPRARSCPRPAPSWPPSPHCCSR